MELLSGNSLARIIIAYEVESNDTGPGKGLGLVGLNF